MNETAHNLDVCLAHVLLALNSAAVAVDAATTSAQYTAADEAWDRINDLAARLDNLLVGATCSR